MINKVIAQREKGLRYFEIAKKLSCAEAYVKRVIKEHLPEMYGEGACRRYAMIVHRMCDERKSYSEIAETLGLNKNTVWQAACIGQDIHNRRTLAELRR